MRNLAIEQSLKCGFSSQIFLIRFFCDFDLSDAVPAVGVKDTDAFSGVDDW
jgi:hypothetical protein